METYGRSQWAIQDERKKKEWNWKERKKLVEEKKEYQLIKFWLLCFMTNQPTRNI